MAEADQNQNPLISTVDDGEEQFMSPDAFMSADNAVDWDMLISHGNNANSQPSMSKWERDSLYVKFDPLVASKRDNTDRASFMFKAPKPPGPSSSLSSSFLKPSGNGNANLSLNDSGSSFVTSAFQDFTMPIIEERSPNDNTSALDMNENGDGDTSSFSTANDCSLGRSSPDVRPNVVTTSSPARKIALVDIGEGEVEAEAGLVDSELCPDLDEDEETSHAPPLNSEVISSTTDNENPSILISEEPLSPASTSVHERSIYDPDKSLMLKFEKLVIRETPQRSGSSGNPNQDGDGSFCDVRSSQSTPTKWNECEPLDSLDATMVRVTSPVSTCADEQEDQIISDSEADESMNFVGRTSSSGKKNLNSTFDAGISPDEDAEQDNLNATFERRTSLGLGDGQACTGQVKDRLNSTFEKGNTSVTGDMPDSLNSTSNFGRENAGLTIVDNRASPPTRDNSSAVPERDEASCVPDRNLSFSESNHNSKTTPKASPAPRKEGRLSSKHSTPALEVVGTPMKRHYLSSQERGTPQTSAVRKSEPLQPAQQAEGDSDVSRSNPLQEKLDRIAKLRESIEVMKAEDAKRKKDSQTKANQKEMDLQKAVDGFVKVKEDLDQRKRATEVMVQERNEAKQDLLTMESGFAELLMMYEGVKGCQTKIEQNCETLRQREVILHQILQQKEDMKEAARETFEKSIEMMNQDFMQKIKEREDDNVRLKAKIRMSEMKTSKLEGEIAQIERENEKLQALCDDMVK